MTLMSFLIPSSTLVSSSRSKASKQAAKPLLVKQSFLQYSKLESNNEIQELNYAIIGELRNRKPAENVDFWILGILIVTVDANAVEFSENALVVRSFAFDIEEGPFGQRMRLRMGRQTGTLQTTERCARCWINQHQSRNNQSNHCERCQETNVAHRTSRHCHFSSLILNCLKNFKLNKNCIEKYINNGCRLTCAVKSVGEGWCCVGGG